MQYLLIVVVVLSLSTPAAAGPLLESARRAATTVALEQDPAPTYRKGSARKWMEWLGIVGGAVALLAVQENCDGVELGDACFGETSWPTGQIGVTSALLAVAAISKALPDPD